MAGPTALGFDAKTFATILSEIEASQRAAPAIGADAILDEFEWIGQNNRIIAAVAAEQWELGRLVHNSGDPRSQEGYILSALAAFSGTKKQAATKTRAPATVNLDAGFTLVAGSTCHVVDQPTLKFSLSADVTNSGGSPANVAAVFLAVDAGPIEALAGTLTAISPTVAGWNSVTNASDAVTGHAEEIDPDLRIRRVVELAAEGSATFDGIQADVEIAKIDGMQSVSLLENDGDNPATVDGITLPGHTVALFIWDGSPPTADDATVAKTLYRTKGAGTGTYGSVSEVVTDAKGNEHTVKFSRLTAVTAWITMTVSYDPKSFDVTNGPAQITKAILARATATQKRAIDVLADQYKAAALSVAGTRKVPAYCQATSDPGPSPADALGDLTITSTQIATFDSVRISVTMVEASPL